jgi:hypothetical protein
MNDLEPGLDWVKEIAQGRTHGRFVKARIPRF